MLYQSMCVFHWRLFRSRERLVHGSKRSCMHLLKVIPRTTSCYAFAQGLSWNRCESVREQRRYIDYTLAITDRQMRRRISYCNHSFVLLCVCFFLLLFKLTCQQEVEIEESMTTTTPFGVDWHCRQGNADVLTKNTNASQPASPCWWLLLF